MDTEVAICDVTLAIPIGGCGYSRIMVKFSPNQKTVGGIGELFTKKGLGL